MQRSHRVFAGALLSALLIFASMGPSNMAEPCIPSIDPTGSIPEYVSVQKCLSGGGWVLLEARTYLIEHTLDLKSNTLLEGPSASRKAVLMASPKMGVEVVLFGKGSNYEVRNVVVDGNKFMRDYATPLQGWEDNRTTTHYLCDADSWRPANTKFHGNDIDIHDFESINAPCGSGMGISADRLRLWNFRIEHNGFEAPEVREGVEMPRKSPNRSHQYSDGVTVEYCGNCVFADGFVGENTDLDFVFGGGPNNHAKNINCYHKQVYGFSCFNVGRFDTGRGWDGNHQGLVFEGNSVSCGFEKCSLGISIGGRFFTNDVTFVVIHDTGLIRDNKIDGAQIGIAVDAVERGKLLDNTIGEVQGSRGNFNYCQLALKYVVGNVKSAVELQPGFVRMTMHGGKCVTL